MDQWVISAVKRCGCDEAGAARIQLAYETAVRAHEGQKRKSGEPYVIHPMAVADMLADMKMDADTVIAGLLHDTVEDTSMTYADVKNLFGVTVADLVDGVTKLSRLPSATQEEAENENLRKLFFAMAKDIRVIIIKLYDRLHNLRTLQFQSERKQREKALETMLIYSPIAHRLGMNSIKNELEDLSLQYLDPVGWKEITDFLHSSSEERDQFLQSIVDKLRKRMEETGINGRVEGRVKHMYGIYRKVYMQNRDIRDVFDIFAVRAIVSDIQDCYNVLGVVHDLFKPIPGRFKDYISSPKPNGYQSLHTTVLGSTGRPFEVQIRTEEMHSTAEYGVAAHWKYKDGVVETGTEDAFAWVRKLLESQDDAEPEDFIQGLRMELFTDEVFVFTPKGDVISLPAEATPIDFAYAIHSAVGNRMVGAKVNGKMAPLDTMLQNGDIVEVLTGAASRGPSRDWMNIVKTSEARNKIRQWFKKERREENIERGRSALENELKRNLLLTAYNDPEIRTKLVERLGFRNAEDMLATIGYGGIPTHKVVHRLNEMVPKAVKPAEAYVRNSKTRPSNGVVVEGVDNCLVKFARCCTPIPGDTIIGFITKGEGVSIHRANCPNAMSLMNDENRGRMIRVAWAGSPDEKYRTWLSVEGKNRIGLLADVATALSEMHIEVNALNANEMPEHIARIDVAVAVANAEILGQVIVRLRTVRGVTEVSRIVR